MNTFLSSDQEALLARYRQFVSQHVAPLATALDQGRHSLEEVFALLGQEGFLSTCVSKEYGGQGAPFLNFILLSQAIAEAEPGLVLSIAAHAQAIELLSRHGSDTQKSRYLPLLARGECIGTFASSEEQAGSDYAALQTRIASTNGKLALSGKKTWVVNGGVAKVVLATARSDDELSIWLVDLEKNNDVRIGPNRKKLGMRSAVSNDIEFTNLELDADSKLKTDSADSADSAILYAQDIGKLIIAAAATGLLEHALTESVDRARTREQFGGNIGKLQAVQWKLADMSAESAATRLMTYRAGWSKDSAPEDFHKFAAMSKFYAARAARVHSSEAVQIFGALGLSDDGPVEKLYRDAKVMEIVEGTNEIQKNIVAKEVGV